MNTSRKDFLNKTEIHIKIPDQLFQKTRETSTEKDVEFYYVLKRVDNSGFIHKRDLLKKISKFTTLTEASIYRRISRLIDSKLVKKTSNGYRICSYKALFIKLGYKEYRYKITSIKSKQSVLHLSAQIEIKKRLEKQAIAAMLMLKDDKTYQRSFQKTRGTLLERLDQVTNDQLAYMIDTNLKSQSIATYCELSQSTTTTAYCNPDITFSFKKIAEILNFKSTSQAFDLMNTLEKIGVVSIERNRLVLVEKNLGYKDFLINYGEEYYRYKERNSYKVLPNKYFFNEQS